jgi:hypothetical protein
MNPAGNDGDPGSVQGSRAGCTVTLGIDGESYEIDITPENARELRALLAGGQRSSVRRAPSRGSGVLPSGSPVPPGHAGRCNSSAAGSGGTGAGRPGAGAVRLLAGCALRRLRTGAGYHLEAAAGFLDCDKSKISRIETGQRGIRMLDLRVLLDRYGASGDERAVLEALAARGRPSWWEPFDGLLSSPARDWVRIESAAAQVMIYEPVRVPDLLQTPGYAHVLAGSSPRQPPGGGDPAQAAALNAVRQRLVLEAPRIRLHAVIGEAALRQDIGAPQAMRDQFTWLAELQRYRLVSIQVLPSATAGAVMPGGPVTIARLTAVPGIEAAWLPDPSGGVILADPHAVAGCERAFWNLSSAALTEHQTRALLEVLAGAGPVEPAVAGFPALSGRRRHRARP